MITLTLLCAIFLQVIFVFAQNAETPSKAVAEFAHRYYGLDPAMKERICSELLENSEINPVDQTIYAAHHEASQRGLSLWMIRNSLAHVNTQLLEKEGDTARVKLEAERKNSLRKFFFRGDPSSGKDRHPAQGRGQVENLR